MTRYLDMALAQLNPTVGDLRGNADLVRAARRAAGDVDLVVTGEMVISGYPPEDLVLNTTFQRHVEEAVLALAAETADGGPALLVGAPWRVEGRLHNAALLLDQGKVAAVVLKHDLPNYGVFDEVRVFAPGPLPAPVPFRGVNLGVMICEDMWSADVAAHLAAGGADLFVVLNASPYELDKPGQRSTLATARAAETGLSLAYVNIMGGQDELVFDGGSFVLDRGGVRVRLPRWRTDVARTRWTNQGGTWTVEEGPRATEPDPQQTIYQALVTGVRDYVNKNHFPGVLIGLSGGVDSALTAAIAVDALGPDRVHCVLMPSPYTAAESREDAELTARAMGASFDVIDIKPAMDAFGDMLREAFVQHPPDTTEENIQARARAITLMALSNKFAYMVLSTGNKSEMSVGYTTLYGDMCGGYSALKDVYKTTVYTLCHWRNAHLPEGGLGPPGTVIPDRVLTKAPSAELKPNQKDQDTLPPYEVLDAMLKTMVEEDETPEDLVARGFDRATAQKVWRLLDLAEYKRRQAPPGVKITRRAFGRDRRYPITNGYTNSR